MAKRRFNTLAARTERMAGVVRWHLVHLHSAAEIKALHAIQNIV